MPALAIVANRLERRMLLAQAAACCFFVQCKKLGSGDLRPSEGYLSRALGSPDQAE